MGQGWRSVDESLVASKRVLISGGSGLLAGRTAEHLAQAGFAVRLGTRNVQAAKAWAPACVELVSINWHDETSLRRACVGMDVIVNAMGMNAADCQADPVAALRVNGAYTASFLRAAVTAQVRRFVYLSTAHVYSGQLQGEIIESTNVTNLHPYATSHRAGEDAVLWADKQGQIEGVVLRLSNAFGRPLNPQTKCWMLLVNDLSRQAVQDRGLRLHSDGMQLRDFIPLGRVCDLIQLLCIAESRFVFQREGSLLPVFNIGSGNAMSVAAMAELVQYRSRAILGYDVPLQKKAANSKQASAELHYHSENLKAPLHVNPEQCAQEIDDLLLFCLKNFRGKS
jgi:UDP-glucose 4-epimerase